MTIQIALVLTILGLSFVLFISERVRMDVVALLVLAVLAVTRLVSPAEALSGFANPAVVTVWAMFMISAGLTFTGVAGWIGRRMMRLVGVGEARIVLVIMATAAVLSAFMNNIGAAALLVPVVMDIARRTGRAPSRLLMPLAFGTLLGGLTTLIGTPPNLLVSEILAREGMKPFEMFDFTPVGGVAALAGIAFVALLGRRLLPLRDVARDSRSDEEDLLTRYALQERTILISIPEGCRLAGRTLRGSRLGKATGLNVVAVMRNGETRTAPSPGFRLEAGDRMLVQGRLERLEELRQWRGLTVEERELDLEGLVSEETTLAELGIPADSALVGSTLVGSRFRNLYGVIVLAVRRRERVIRKGLATLPLERDDRMLVLGERVRLKAMRENADLETFESRDSGALTAEYSSGSSLFLVRVPPDSVLRFKSLAESRFGDALSLGVLGIRRGDRTLVLPGPDERLLGDDRLIVQGDPEQVEVFHGLQELDIEEEPPPDLRSLEPERTTIVEAILSPRTALAGKTLSQSRFRERHCVLVLAINSHGRTIRSNLAQHRLRFGDALLLFGRRGDLGRLGSDPDVVLLTEHVQPEVRSRLAPVAAAVLGGVVACAVAGWLPISIASVAGATLMVLTGCLSMEDAYRAVEWRSIFLIAGMLPLGTAMQQTGAAAFVAEGVLGAVGGLGPWGVVVALYLVTAAATMIIPTAALVVVMAPIAMKAAAESGIAVDSVMMAVAVAASASFTSPISHPANLLVMGPGGYRFVDYLRLGGLLTIVVMVAALAALPWLWPFSG